MINRNAVRIQKPSFIPKYSDTDLLRTVIQSNVWKSFYFNKKEALWELFKGLYYFKTELFISPVRGLLRHSFGTRTSGYFIVLMSTIMMIGFNSKTRWGVSSNLFPFLAPFFVSVMDYEQINATVFGDIQSEGFMYFWMITTVISLVHLVRIHMRKGEDIPATKRGISWLHQGVFRHMNISEGWVQNLIEPLIICGIGSGLIYLNIDLVFGFFLVISGFCLFIQEMQDAILKTAMG